LPNGVTVLEIAEPALDHYTGLMNRSIEGRGRMRQLGAYEAKTRLAALLDDVARGESIVITRRGKPVARLVPVTSSEDEVAAVISRMKAARRSRGSMSLAEILAARDEGRR
jgi:prevent-host-death family protein